MKRGRVIGEVWATRKHPGVEGHKLLLVAVVAAREGGRSAPTGEVVVAVDTLDAAPGQDVLVSWGSGARTAVASRHTDTVLADAAVSVILAETFD